MRADMFRYFFAVAACMGVPPSSSWSRADELPGFRAEVRVQLPARLDWEFVAAGLGSEGGRAAPGYESRQVRYQLFVPSGYDAARAWPLIVFVSPGDDPLGWPRWKGLCEDKGVFFCAVYGAGTNGDSGQRARRILDMLDDLRRRCRIDPERTYAAGFSEGAPLAGALALSLPEYFGGAVLLSGTCPGPRLEYLRYRARDRLSLALVAGKDEPARRELEEAASPYWKDLDIRSRLWIEPRLGHALPSAAVLAEVFAWLEHDLPRRRAEVKQRPLLAVSPDEALTERQQAERALETAQGELDQPDRTARAAALLDGVLVRWPRLATAETARKKRVELQADPALRRRLTEQGAAEDRRVLSCEARRKERSGDALAALAYWQTLATIHAGSEEGRAARREADRLSVALARAPYLGLRCEGDTTRVLEIVPGGPADRAGLRPGDRLVKLAAERVETPADLRRVLTGRAAGSQLSVEFQRDRQVMTGSLTVGLTPQGK